MEMAGTINFVQLEGVQANKQGRGQGTLLMFVYFYDSILPFYHQSHFTS